MNLSTDLIDPSPLNPRKHFNEVALAELAESIREQGVLQPLTVRVSRENDDRYEIVIGERRYRASKMAELEEVPVIVRELSDEQTLEIMLVENAAREDVSALEEADAICKLAADFERDTVSIAAKLGRPEAFVRRRMRLGALIEPLRSLLFAERIGIGAAELLAVLPVELQEELAGDSLSADTQEWNGDPKKWSRHQVRTAIERASRQIARALWALKEEVGGKPPCGDCPKRSSCQPSLLQEFADDDDRCLDSACWEVKQTAWLAEQRDAGVKILEGDEAEKALRYRSKKQKRLTDTIKTNDGYEYVSDVVSDAVPRVIAVGASGPIEFVNTDDLVADLEERGKVDVAKKVSGEADKEERAAERERKRLEREARRAAMAEVVETASKQRGFAAIVDILIEGAASELNQDVLREVCARRDLNVEKGDYSKLYGKAVRGHAETLSFNDRIGLLVELLVTRAADNHNFARPAPAWARARALVDGTEPELRALEERIVAGEIPTAEQLTGISQWTLRGVLEGLDVQASELYSKSEEELVQLIIAYAETDPSCVAARNAQDKTEDDVFEEVDRDDIPPRNLYADYVPDDPKQKIYGSTNPQVVASLTDCVHVLEFGRALCDEFDDVPGDWPEGHYWVPSGRHNVKHATCAECVDRLDGSASKAAAE